MTAVYKYGFADGTPVGEAKERALALVRAPEAEGGAGDQDTVIAGPDVVQPDAMAEAGTFLIRIVTGAEGAEDPAVVAARERAPRPPAQADAMVGRLLDLPPAKLAALSALLDRLEE